MLPRSALVLCAALACSACSNQQVVSASFGPSAAAAAEAPGVDEAHKKNLADRVLTAIALERVTGRKPDPGRLAQAY